MDNKPDEEINESTINSTDISKEKCPADQQKGDAKSKQMNAEHPENNKIASFIQASKGKRKYSSISDEVANSEQSRNPNSVLLDSNLNCGANELNLDKCASFKRCSENFKRDFSSETGLVRGHNITSNATGLITEQIIGESYVSSMVHAASDEESEISSEGGKGHSLNEDTKNFLGSKEVNKDAGVGSKRLRIFPKSDIAPRNKEPDSISGMDFKDGQILSGVASAVCCGNKETEANVEETLNTRNNARAEAAGPSGIRQRNENGFACNLCGEEFAESWEFDAHYRTHRAFVCNICQSKFTQKAHLERHYRTHTGEKPFMCEICKKRFSRQEGLKSHSMTHTDEKPFVCEICKKGFSQKEGLESHYRKHTGKKPYVCVVCKKEFAHHCRFKIHYRTHTGEKPFVCDVCKKGFTQKVHLDRHSITHTGEKPFVCEICKKRFSQQEGLGSHNRTHTGEKPYECVVCKKGFAWQGHLKKHYRIHTGEKPFVCEICKKDFADRSNLAKHARKHTGEKPYKCPICGKAYFDSSSCSRHYKEKHK